MKKFFRHRANGLYNSDTNWLHQVGRMVKNIINLWKEYKLDFGLGAMGLVIISYNALLFLLSGLVFGFYNFYCLIPIGVYLLFFCLRKKSKRPLVTFLMSLTPLAISIGANYLLVGHIDVMAGVLPRQDSLFVEFDKWLFGMQVAQYFEQLVISWNEIFKKVFYDYLVISYMSYYFLPFYAGVLYYKLLPSHEKYKMVSYYSTIVVCYGINFLFYLFIPVTGPQYFVRELFTDSMPMSFVGEFFYSLVHYGQYTKIDCFPSGHTGIAVLVCLWLYKMKHPHLKYCLFVTFSIMLATLGLRYHYTLDLLAAFPMALLSFYLGIRLFPEKIVEDLRERQADPGSNTD
ncbi:phosphatase PAP2 family protein [Bacteriovoracales bacterium]|nr:phosphatase PAP2 family protein [Bacteriovoracales bacterium]